jgi:hypothetical protein
MQTNSGKSHDANRSRGRRRFVPAMIACALALTVVIGCNPSPLQTSTPTHTVRPAPALQFSPETLPDAQVGSPYAATITVGQTATPVGGASVSAGALPAGLELALSEQHDSKIQISGTPAAAGTFRFSIYVWCYGTMVSGQTATHEYTLVVK